MKIVILCYEISDCLLAKILIFPANPLDKCDFEVKTAIFWLKWNLVDHFFDDPIDEVIRGGGGVGDDGEGEPVAGVCLTVAAQSAGVFNYAGLGKYSVAVGGLVESVSFFQGAGFGVGQGIAVKRGLGVVEHIG